MAVRTAAKLYDIPLTTLRDRVDNRISIDVTKSGPDPLLSQLEEARLVKYLIYMSNLGYGYTRSQVMELGTDLALHLGKRKKDDPPLSRTWFSNYMGRWPELRVIKPRGLAVIRAKCASREKIAAYYEELKRILQKYDLEDKSEAIYNIDEKGLPTEHKPPDIVTGKNSGGQSITSPKDKITTVIGAGSAIGHQIPPFYIFAGKRKIDHLIDGGLPGTDYTVTESGWSNADVFEEYMKDHFSTYVHVKEGEHHLVLYDGHASHVTLSLIDWAKERNIILFLLSPHTSHILQPLDVGCFGPLQKIYNKECSSYLRKNPGQVVCRLNICQISAKAYSLALSPENLRSSFRRAGIYPYNPEAVPSYLLKPSKVYRNAQDQNPKEQEIQECGATAELETHVDDHELIAIQEMQAHTQSAGVTEDTPESDEEHYMKTFFDTRKIQPTKEKTLKKPRRNLNALISGQAITEETVYEKIVDYKQQSKGKSKQKRQLEDSQKSTKKNGKKQKKEKENNSVGAKKSTSKAGCSYMYISDSELSDFSDDNGDPCCVCKKGSPPRLKDCLDIVIIKWAQCEHCQHWTHLRFCAKERVIRLNQTFLCPCCTVTE